MVKNLPRHIAIIPDGNRRWAKGRGKRAWEGHREGVIRFREVAEEAFRLRIPYLTFWAASEDNLRKRSRLEIKFLVSLLKRELLDSDLRTRLFKNEVSFRMVGWWGEFINDKSLKRSVQKLEKETEKFHKKRLTILFGYDGKREIVEAVKLLGEKSSKANFELIKNHLLTGDLPPVDLVIRTGGESHWSGGFMMWQTADSQLYFTDKLWPEFDVKKFHRALADYSRRERRLGA